MTTTPALRWLKLSLLPVFAAAYYVVQTETLYGFVRIAKARQFDDLAVAGIFSSYLVGPILIALACCYPLARLYARHAGIASLVIALPTIVNSITVWNDDFSERVVAVSYLLPLTILLPALAWLTHSALSASRIEIMPTASPLPSPRTLKWVLLPFLSGGMFVLHDLIQPVLWHAVFTIETRPIMLTAFLSGGFIGPTLVALVLAYPIAGIYGRRAPLVGMLISIPTVWYWLSGYFDGNHKSPFTVAAFTIEMLSASIMPALATWVVQRRLGDTRLVVVDKETS